MVTGAKKAIGSKGTPLNPRWPSLKAGECSRPVVWINCAISLDGRLAYAGGRRALFSGPEDLKRVQRLRATADAILVGAGTVRLDDPSLRIHWESLEGEELPLSLSRSRSKPPLRVLLGSKEGLSPSARILDGTLPTVVFAPEGGEALYPSHVTVVPCQGPRVDLIQALQWLKDLGVRRLMVEGGSGVLTSFLGWAPPGSAPRTPPSGFPTSGLVDRLTVYVSPLLIGGMRSPAFFAGGESHGREEAVPLRLLGTELIDDGVLLTYAPRLARR